MCQVQKTIIELHYDPCSVDGAALFFQLSRSLQSQHNYAKPTPVAQSFPCFPSPTHHLNTRTNNKDAGDENDDNNNCMRYEQTQKTYPKASARQRVAGIDNKQRKQSVSVQLTRRRAPHFPFPITRYRLPLEGVEGGRRMESSATKIKCKYFVGLCYNIYKR